MDDTGESLTLGGLLIDRDVAYLALVVATLDDRAETQRHTFLWITRFHTLGRSTGSPIFWPMTHFSSPFSPFRACHWGSAVLILELQTHCLHQTALNHAHSHQCVLNEHDTHAHRSN